MTETRIFPHIIIPATPDDEDFDMTFPNIGLVNTPIANEGEGMLEASSEAIIDGDYQCSGNCSTSAAWRVVFESLRAELPEASLPKNISRAELLSRGNLLVSALA